jgi:alpha-L-rhamnosidase
MFGQIVSDWRIVKEKFEWDIVVPPNTTATVTLPNEEAGSEVEAGKYHFTKEI